MHTGAKSIPLPDPVSRRLQDLPGLSPGLSRWLPGWTWSFDNSFTQENALHAFGEYRVFDLPPLHARSRRLTEIGKPTEPPPLKSVLQQDRIQLGEFNVITAPVAFELETDWGRVSLNVSQADQESETQTEQMSRAMRRINNVAIVLDLRDPS